MPIVEKQDKGDSIVKGREICKYSIFLVILLILPVTSAGTFGFDINERYTASYMVPVWVDNFNVGLDNWRIWGFNESADPIVSTAGNFSNVDHTLRAYGEEWNVAQHNSTVAYGTWSFDIDLVQTPRNHCLVAFISGWEDTPPPGQELVIDPSYSYGMIFATGEFRNQNTSFVLFRRSAGMTGVTDIATYDPDNDPESSGWHEGWYHIDITRDTRNKFKVFINGTLRMEVTDNSFTTSEVFYIHAEAGIALDVVDVNNEVKIDPNTIPEFVEASDKEYFEGETVSYQMAAWDPAGIFTWLVNDTANFEISSTGLLTSKTTLSVGIYYLNITIVDNPRPDYDYNSRIITITVLANTPTTPTTPTNGGGEPIDLTLLLVAGGGIAVVVIVALVVKSKR